MATSKKVNNLTINKVESQEVYNYMASNNLINEDELYLVEGDEYTNATQSKSGLMSNTDKSKLDGIADGANKTIIDSSLSTTSTNPVQNKVIKTELDKKADKTALDAKADKTALDGKLDKTGGTLTGNLTGKYFTGTWLQTTEATDLGRTPGKIAVLDESGWVYYRTPLELLADLGTETVDEILGLVYPVGSIYMSINNVSPATLFGGKWVQIKGRFLLGASDVYKANTTGGEVAHTLTNDEMPNHQHSIWFPNSGGEQSAEIGYPETGSKNTYYAEASKTSGTGGGAAHNNMPPYLVVYMWRRLS